jgi:hypothetical protein
VKSVPLFRFRGCDGDHKKVDCIRLKRAGEIPATSIASKERQGRGRPE